ncbi:hypothetical protein ACFC8F_23105 [Streptomyces hydrogenans]|uniref:hypothetical protein n=1 Tax=Streptomyces hydrogenans TaxID=1873719 RepID=UPI0035D958AC
MLAPDRVERVQAHLDSTRRSLDLVRSYTGRAATVVGTAGATAGLFTPALLGESLLATLGTTAAGLLFLPLHKAKKTKSVRETERSHRGMASWTRKVPTHQSRTAALMYVAPGAGLGVLLVAEQIVPGVHWAECLAVALWSAGTWWLRPGRAARHMLVPPLPPLETAPVDDLAVVEEPVYDHPAAQWWAEHAAAEGGVLPDTVLEDVEQTGERAMRAIIRSAVPGMPVPRVGDAEISRLSALMDVPEDEIKVQPVPGRGSSVRLLTVGTAADAVLDARTHWATRIAPLAMPGAQITAINFGTMRKETP